VVEKAVPLVRLPLWRSIASQTAAFVPADVTTHAGLNGVFGTRGLSGVLPSASSIVKPAADSWLDGSDFRYLVDTSDAASFGAAPSWTVYMLVAFATCAVAWMIAEALELLVDSWKRGPRNRAPASARPMNRMTPMIPIRTLEM
jgi:hypothetical protein